MNVLCLLMTVTLIPTARTLKDIFCVLVKVDLQETPLFVKVNPDLQYQAISVIFSDFFKDCFVKVKTELIVGSLYWPGEASSRPNALVSTATAFKVVDKPAGGLKI